MSETTEIIQASENDIYEITVEEDLVVDSSPISESNESLLDKIRKPEFKMKLIYSGILLLIAIVSFFFISSWASDSNTYSKVFETLDEKKNNVLAMVATITTASGIASIIPNNAGQPIANKLLELDSYLIVILTVIYLEKFLATTLGWASFSFIIPIALIIFIVALFKDNNIRLKANLNQIATKLLLFGLAMSLLVPVSVGITDRIDESFAYSLEQSQTEIEDTTNQLSESTEKLAQLEDQKSNTSENQEQDNNSSDSQKESKGWFFDAIDNISNTASNAIDTAQKGITDIASNVANTAQDIMNAIKAGIDSLGKTLNTLLDTLAVMIVTSCAVPILVLAVFLYLIKVLTGVDYGGVGGVMQRASNASKKVSKKLESTKKKAISNK